MALSDPVRDRVRARLERLYGAGAETCLAGVERIAERHADLRRRDPESLWSERDVVLITYGDQVREPEGSALAAQDRFLRDYGLDECLSTVHVLPFFPWTSDDGFSVVDYRAVDPQVGDWSDIDRLGKTFDLMFDLVLNHCSRRSEWFEAYLRGEPPYDRFFIEVDPSTDLGAVTRPRSLPLLTPFETSRGTRHLWTTFSDDQVDLNFAEPETLLAMLDILLLYVSRGARIVRLDAIAYLWKRIGTPCIHLPETHEVVRLMRDLLDELAPGTVLLTETNVPHAENVSYFGDGDEARMVYQFSLAPLLLDAYLTGDVGPLRSWLAGLEPAAPGTTYFNFTASHDGVGVRPLEGLVPEERLHALVEAVRNRGGLISTKRDTDGGDSPYELNITWASALGDPTGLPPAVQARRIISSQSVMVALRGIPGVYFHSLVGTENWREGVDASGRARSINRRKFTRDELDARLTADGTLAAMVFQAYAALLETRARHAAFHPDAPQRVLDPGVDGVLAFERTSLDATERVLVLASVLDRPVTVDLSALGYDGGDTRDLLTDRVVSGPALELPAWGAAWIAS